MRLTLLLAGALVPAEAAAELIPRLQAPTLERLLARARLRDTAQAAQGKADAVWLARAMHGSPETAPTAPYAWAALTGKIESDRTLWHADPIHVAAGRDHLVVHTLETAPDEVEADALIRSGNAVLAEAGCELLRCGVHWFLSSAESWTLRHRPTAAMLGRPLPMAAHDDPDALRWSRLHNALQMQWHADAVNRARESRGLPTVDAVWLHGGGRWHALPSPRWPLICTDRPELRGAAMAAGAEVRPAAAAASDGALLVWDDADFAHGFDAGRWLAAMQVIDRRLAGLRAATLELVLTGGSLSRTWVARPADRLRVWQRARLAQAIAA